MNQRVTGVSSTAQARTSYRPGMVYQVYVSSFPDSLRTWSSLFYKRYCLHKCN